VLKQMLKLCRYQHRVSTVFPPGTRIQYARLSALSFVGGVAVVEFGRGSDGV
jgi:hypothetical protein